MNNVVLDSDLVVDLLGDRHPGKQMAESIVQEAIHRGCDLWIAASSLPGILGRLVAEFSTTGVTPDDDSALTRARSLLADALRKIKVLSSFGFDAAEALSSTDPEGTLLLRAADALDGDVLILTRNKKLLEADKRTRAPELFLHSSDDPTDGGRDFPFIDLARQQHRLLPQLEKKICDTLRHGNYIMGREINELEQRLCEFVGAKHAICCASGTDALLLALMAWDIGPGDAVFTTPFTFIATAEVISLLGATPVFVDIDPKTFNINPGSLLSAIEAVETDDASVYPLPKRDTARKLKPRVVITVDLFGLPCDYEPILSIARSRGMYLLEDGAQSFGAKYKGKMSCSLGDISCTSFFPAKPLGGYGDGGAVFTDSDEWAEVMKSIRIHGIGEHRYDNVRIGLNARMDTLQAAVLIPKLDVFPWELGERQRVADQYTKLLASCGSIQTPSVPEGLISAWAQYSLLSDRRVDIQAALKSKGIPTAVYYPKSLHLQTAFADLGYTEGSFPVSEDCSKHIFSLPMHPYLEFRQIERIAEIIMEAARNGIQ